MAGNGLVQAAPIGGEVYITVKTDEKGVPLAVPQAFQIPECVNFKVDQKGDLKEVHGNGRFALYTINGKESVKFSLEIPQMIMRVINNLTGASSNTAEGSRTVLKDDVVIPEFVTLQQKIRERIGYNVAIISSKTSLTINGVASTAVTLPNLKVGKHVYSAGKITFHKKDVGKTAVLTYVSRGKTLISTFKIPTTLVYSVKDFTKNVLVKVDGGATLSVERFDLSDNTIAANSYMQSGTGLYLFNGAQTSDDYIIRHVTSGVTVDTKVALDNTSDGFYKIWIDPPGSAELVSIESVTLADGTLLTETAGTPTTGQYNPDIATASIEFAAADDGDVVLINYLPDVITVKPSYLSDDTVEFLEMRGVSYFNGSPFDFVAMETPLAIEKGQVVALSSGNLLFDYTDAGARVKIAALCKTEDGLTIADENRIMGSGVILGLTYHCNFEGQHITYDFPKVKSSGGGFDTKPDDVGMIKIELQAACDDNGLMAYKSAAAV